MRIAVIPARGKSERLPRKNIRSFYGKPMLAYTIETALASKLFGQVYVSTDDAEIAEVAAKYGAVPTMRPAHLAASNVGTPEVMQHHASEWALRRAAYLACLYPCAPLMTVEDLHLAFEKLKAYGADYAFGFCDDPLRDSGSYYFGKYSAFAEGRTMFGPDTLMIPVPPERCCDINCERDWVRAELLYAAMRKKAA